LPRIKSSVAKTAKAGNTTSSSPAGPETAKGLEIRPAQPVGKDHAKTSEIRHHDDAHKIYTVAKGDNPVSIAKKFKVSYDELLALNHIDDPRKLKIGQKLLIPNKTVKGKKSDE
jgi:LysM repeat protein